MSDLLKPQPAPVQSERDNPACWPQVIVEAGHLPELIPDMLERDRIGRERYGVPLRVWNGRDALADAYQEALDLAVYLEQCRQRVPAAATELIPGAFVPYSPHDLLRSLRNEVLSILQTMRRLQGKVPVQTFVAHEGSPTLRETPTDFIPCLREEP